MGIAGGQRRETESRRAARSVPRRVDGYVREGIEIRGGTRKRFVYYET